MSEAETKVFGGFQPADRTFSVTGYALKPVRRWRRDSVESAEDPAFSIWISGIGIADTDNIKIIGTDCRSKEFDLSICSDHDSIKGWQRMRELSELAYGEEGVGTPEQKLRNFQFDLLDKSPPTATLFFTAEEPERHIKGGWSLECRIPESVLLEFAAGIASRQVDQVSIGIKWVGGLIDPSHLLPDWFGRTWGMFTLPGDTTPEPLWGHISVFEWTPNREGLALKLPHSDRLTEVCDEWINSFLAQAEDERRQSTQAAIPINRIKSILSELAEGITKWCILDQEQQWSPRQLKARLDSAQGFLRRLDEALHHRDGPFSKEAYILWSHRNIVQLYQSTKASHRVNFIDKDELDRTIDEYILNPWLHNPYIDWVMLDAITATNIVAVTEVYLKQKYGVAYVVANGVKWKTSVWKLLLWLIALGFPAVAYYFIAKRSVPFAIATGGLWYGLLLLGVILRLWSKVSLLFATGQTPGRRLWRLDDEMERVYGWLSGPVLHVSSVRRAFDRSVERGVVWDQRVFYILDHLSNQKPKLWSRWLPYVR